LRKYGSARILSETLITVMPSLAFSLRSEPVSKYSNVHLRNTRMHLKGREHSMGEVNPEPKPRQWWKDISGCSTDKMKLRSYDGYWWTVDNVDGISGLIYEACISNEDILKHWEYIPE
jgi:hypothetical protein